MSLTTIFDTKDSVFFVGGRGTKAGDANAGGCLASLWGNLSSPSMILSNIMGTNGEPLSDASAWNGSQTACVVSHNGSGKARITKAGAFSNCVVGLVANVVSTGVLPADVNDRFEITAVDPSGNYVDCNFEVVSGGTCDIKAGGAFDKIQTASDETTADSLTLAHNVDILTNKAETFSGVGDQIDIDTGGGDTASGTKKRIIGIDDSGVKLAAGSWVTIDADGNACHVIAVGGQMDDTEIHHLHTTNNTGAGNSGFYVHPSSVSTGIIIGECKSTNCVRGLTADTTQINGIAVVGGYYSSNNDSPIYIHAVYGSAILGVTVVCTVNQPAIVCQGYGATPIRGCVIIGNGNIACVGIKTAAMYAMGVAEYNVMYDVGHGFQINETRAGLIESNNIIVVATAAAGKAIDYSSGDIIHSDYSCLWALDGAPAAADRWGGVGIGEHSIEQDPLFFDAANQDFRLKMNSPCKRTGNPTLGKL